MPKVPTQDNFSVAPSIAPSVQLDAPKAQNYAAEQAQQMGQATLSLGLKLQQQADRVRLDDAETQAQKVLMSRESELKKLKGSDALFRGDKPLDDEYDELLAKDLEGIGSTLGSNSQKQAWALASNEMRRNFQAKSTGHLAQEYQTYEMDTAKGMVTTGQQKVIQQFDQPDEVVAGMSAIKAGVERMTRGKPKEYTQAAMVEALSPAHAGVIQGMLQGNAVQAAKDYFARPEVQAEMMPEVRARVSEILTVSVATMAGQTAARDAIVEAGANWSVKEVDARILQKFPNDPAAVEVARREIRYQKQLDDDNRSQVKETLLAPVQRILGDADRTGSMINPNRPELVSLKTTNAALYRETMNQVDAHNHQLTERRKQTKNWLETESKTNRDFNAVSIKFDMITNPNKYKGADIKALFLPLVQKGTISASDAESLGNTWGQINKPKSSADFTTLTTADMYLQSRLNGSMVNVNGNMKKFSALDKETQAEYLSRARTELDRVLVGMQELTGKADKSQVRQVVDGLFLDTGARSAIFGIKYGATENVSKLDLTAYSQIPQADRSRIIAALKKTNQPVTEEAVAAYYMATAGAK